MQAAEADHLMSQSIYEQHTMPAFFARAKRDDDFWAHLQQPQQERDKLPTLCPPRTQVLSPRTSRRNVRYPSPWDPCPALCTGKQMCQSLSRVWLFATQWTAGSSVHWILHARTLEWVAISLFQGIFAIQGWNPGLLHYRRILYHLSHLGSPYFIPKEPKSLHHAEWGPTIHREPCIQHCLLVSMCIWDQVGNLAQCSVPNKKQLTLLTSCLHRH